MEQEGVRAFSGVLLAYAVTVSNVMFDFHFGLLSQLAALTPNSSAFSRSSELQRLS